MTVTPMFRKAQRMVVGSEAAPVRAERSEATDSLTAAKQRMRPNNLAKKDNDL